MNRTFENFALALCAILLAPQPSWADAYVTDAFGLFPATETGERTEWSGVRTHFEGGLFAGQTTHPAGPATQLEVVFGEKSIITETGTAQFAILAKDAFGNLAAEGTQIIASAHDGAISAYTTHGIASRPVAGDGEIGTHYAWANLAAPGAQVQSARFEYRIVSDLSTLTFALSPAEANLPVDATHRLTAQPVTGQSHDTSLATTTILAHDDGASSVVPGLWTGHLHEARVLTRDLTGTFLATLHLPFQISDDVTFAVEDTRLVPNVLIRAEQHVATGTTAIEIGPLATDTGHFVPEGTTVQTTLRDGTGTTFETTSWTMDGNLTITVPTLALPTTVTIDTAYGQAELQIADTQVQP